MQTFKKIFLASFSLVFLSASLIFLNNYDEKGNNYSTDVLVSPAAAYDSADGDLQLKVRSYAPTSSAYKITKNEGFDLGLEGIRIKIEPVNSEENLIDVGNLEETTISAPRDFKFQPALTATPSALSFEDGEYKKSVEAVRNITINAAKRFGVDLENDSSEKDLSNISLGLLLHSNEDNVVWGDAKIDATSGIPSKNLELETSEDFADSPTNPNWNSLPNPIDDFSTNQKTDIRIQATPVLGVGKKTDESFSSSFQTYLNYFVDGRNPKYPAEKLNLGGEAEVFNVNIQITGTAHSDIDFSTNLNDSEIGKNIGDVFREEIKSGVEKNITRFKNDESILNDSSCRPFSDVEINDSNWDYLDGCHFSENSVFYVKDTDVIISALPAGNKTIVVYGGNVLINGDLKPENSLDAFGIIALKSEENGGDITPLGSGGNIFITPNVTNISAAVYSEGSVVSVNEDIRPQEDQSPNCDGHNGFCDRSAELRNQLYWQGSIISENTIGGSDRDPPVCPKNLESVCDSQRDYARMFDFNYLRTFHPYSGGKRAKGIPPVEDHVNNHAFVIEYSNRLKNNPPPLFAEN